MRTTCCNGKISLDVVPPGERSQHGENFRQDYVITDPLLFCATDAGGARNLAPVARLAGPQGVVLGSATTAPLFAEYGIAPLVEPIGTAATATAFLDRVRPQALICGTSRYIDAERMLTAAARNRAVPSVAVLDEWFDYRARFVDGSGALTFLTDLVCCPDENAREEATQDGLPGDRLLATGSPSLAALADKIAKFAANPPPLPAYWEAGEAVRRILFLSETHACDYGDNADRPGPQGSWLGYTEHDVRAALGRAVSEVATPCTIVEKLHPSATQVPPPASQLCDWRVVLHEPLWPLLWHADLVIGMRSMALLEAALMGHRPLSFQPNLQGPDRCTAVRLGLAQRACSENELTMWLRSPPARAAFRRPTFADRRSSSNVLDAVHKLASARRSARLFATP